MDLKKILEKDLTKKELKVFRKSFEIIGDIAILEIPEELEKKEKKIAETVLKQHKHIKTIVKKLSGRKGEFRLKDYKILKGKSTETIHKESGCQYKVDIRKVYFSGRESHERLRILEQVNDRERILVMFAGIGPYGILLAKKKDVDVVCVESNPDACKYAEENVFLNKVPKVKVICDDVRNLDLEKFDRIIMPLPESASDFLDVALKHSKKGTIIHLYGVAEEKDKKLDFSRLEEKIRKIFKNDLIQKGKGVKILKEQKVLPYAVRMYKVCIDFKIL